MLIRILRKDLPTETNSRRPRGTLVVPDSIRIFKLVSTFALGWRDIFSSFWLEELRSFFTKHVKFGLSKFLCQAFFRNLGKGY